MSPTCRSVYLTAAALGLELELILVDVWKKQQFTESFLKINPTHTIPTLDDNGTIVWDSNAINIYLVSKYGKDDSLYPNDIKIRALINQRLFYNAGVIFNLGKTLILKIARKKPLDKEDFLEIKKIYDTLEKFLESTIWIGCDTVSIADFAVFPCMTLLLIYDPLDPKKYPKLSKWVQNVENLPYLHVTRKGTEDLKKFVNDRSTMKSSL